MEEVGDIDWLVDFVKGWGKEGRKKERIKGIVGERTRNRISLLTSSSNEVPIIRVFTQSIPQYL